MIVLDLQSRIPIYEQLKSKIYELAAAGLIKEGDQLPPVRSFARELGVNPNTVQKAYQDLERDGLIRSITGKGSFLNEEAKLKSMLERQYLQKITQAAALAKQCGIPLELALGAAKKAYEEVENS